MERTYIMLKPDALQRGIAGEIIARIERKGYRITHMKTMQLDEAILREHYAHIVDKPFFPPTVEYMTSGPVLAMVVEGENVILFRRGVSDGASQNPHYARRAARPEGLPPRPPAGRQL